MSKKEYKIPLIWECYRNITVEAESLQEAAEIAIQQFMNEPDDDYVDDSVDIDMDIIHEDNYPETVDRVIAIENGIKRYTKQQSWKV